MTEIKKDGEAGWFSENIVDPEFRRSYERETAAEDFLGQSSDHATRACAHSTRQDHGMQPGQLTR